MQNSGERISRGMVAKIMREKGLKSRTVKKYKATTNSDHDLPVVANLLLRERSEVERLNPKTGKLQDKYERTFKFDKINMAWVSDPGIHRPADDFLAAFSTFAPVKKQWRLYFGI